MTDEEIIAAFAAFIARECDAPLSVTRKVIEEWIAKIKKGCRRVEIHSGLS